MLPLLKKTVPTKKSSVGVSSAAFNPLTFDSGNLLALYDGDVGLTNLVWNDQGAGAHNIAFTGLPTIVPGAVNGHQTVLFNGATQWGVVATPLMNQPYTQYCVFRQIVWTGEVITGSGTLANCTLQQFVADPNIIIFSGFAVQGVPDLGLNIFGMFTSVFNSASSQIRMNNNAAVVDDAGAIQGSGVSVAGTFSGGLLCNCEIAYLIIRNGADSVSFQDAFITFLMARFAL